MSALLDRVIEDVPLWPFEAHPGQLESGLPSWYSGMEWFRYLRMAIDAGYYALAAVNYARKAIREGADHYVVICGARYIAPETTGAYRSEILISCPARTSPAEEWVDAVEFLRERGGYNVILVRPA